MDRNQIIGIVIIVLILIGYSIFTAPSEEEKIEIQRKRDSARQARLEQIKLDSIQKAEKDSFAKISENQIIHNDSILSETTQSDSALVLNNKVQLGIFSETATGKQEFITLQNNLVEIKLSTKGGYPYYARLKEFKKFDGDSLILFDNDENIFSMNFYADNKAISTKDLFFEPISGESIVNVESSAKSVTLRLNAGVGKYVEYVYTLDPESYLLKFDINLVGLDQNMAQNSSFIDIIWESKLRKQEKGEQWENQNSTVYYKFYQDEVKYLSETSDEKEEKIDTRLKWIAFKDQFFSSILIAKDYLSTADVKYTKDQEQEFYLKYFKSEITVPYEKKANEQIQLNYYFGPNDYDILRKMSVNEGDDLQLKRLIPLGWMVFRWVNQFIVVPLFNLLGSFIGNYGLIILLMTIIIKIFLFPLTYKSYTSSAKMRVLKPQIEEINKKIPKEKSMERQKATMALYKKVGVNPMGGCLPMLLQFPIIIAMFRFFPASIELRQKSFLWADDLSTYDSILDLGFEIPMYGSHVSLFTLLMAVALLVSTVMNKNQMSGGSTQMPGMKYMLYLMPVMMLVWFNNYSAGLSFYYFLSNTITIGQTLIIRRMIDEDKLLAKLNAQKKKPVKKSKWQARLENMQKQQSGRKKKK